jgi:hypothetical protein
MLPAWFLQTIADLLHAKQSPELPSRKLQEGIRTFPQLSLLKPRPAKFPTGKKQSSVDQSLEMRRLRRLVEKQILYEFGDWFLLHSSSPYSTGR